MVRIFARKAQNPSNPSRRCALPSSAATHGNWSLREARQDRKGPLDCFVSPESPRRELPPSLKSGAGQPPSCALLWLSPPPKITLGEFAIPRRQWRARPRRERLVVVPGLPRRVRAKASPPSRVGATVSHPCLDQRSRFDQEDTPPRF
jgi:hypothetical protein